MRRTLPVALVSATLALSACQDTSQPLLPTDPSAAVVQTPVTMAQQAERVMPGRVLARLLDGADPATVGQAHGLAVAQQHRGFTAFTGAVGNERALAARLAGDDRVVWAEPDYLRQTTEVNPTLLWAFHNPGDLAIYYTRGRNNGKPVTSLLSVENADENVLGVDGAGGAPVAIASIDTGVDFGHVEFSAATMVAGWDYYDNDAGPNDTNGHGTHTTGTMTGDNVGVAGVAGAASKITVHVYRVCGALGCPTSAIVSAIYAATDAGVVAMNLSLGGGSLSYAEEAAIQYATDNHALVIASAGNDGTSTVSCPACDSNAISVAASDWLDQHAYYTNYGNGLDLIAPGGELYSNTTSEAGIYSSVPGGYAYYQGTSMAAPQVTGAAAVVASMTGLTGAALRARLENNARDLGSAGYDTQYGNGRLDLEAALGGGGTPSTDPPTNPDPLAASFSYGCRGLTCTFDASGSTGATSWDWTFGEDDSSASGETTSHMYAAADTYEVTLTVGDGTSTDSDTQTVTCSLKGKKVRCN
jgi:serine protease